MFALVLCGILLNHVSSHDIEKNLNILVDNTGSENEETDETLIDISESNIAETSPEESSEEISNGESSDLADTSNEESSEEASTPDSSTPEESTEEASTPEASTPEESTAEESTPDASTATADESSEEASTPEASTPEESTQEASTPEVPTPAESSSTSEVETESEDPELPHFSFIVDVPRKEYQFRAEEKCIIDIQFSLTYGYFIPSNLHNYPSIHVKIIGNDNKTIIKDA